MAKLLTPLRPASYPQANKQKGCSASSRHGPQTQPHIVHLYFLQTLFFTQVKKTDYFLNGFQVAPQAQLIQAHNTLQISSPYNAHIKVSLLVQWKECAQLEIISNSMDFIYGPTNQQIITMLQRSYFILVRTSKQALEIRTELSKKLLAQLLPEVQNSFLLYSKKSNPNSAKETSFLKDI